MAVIKKYKWKSATFLNGGCDICGDTTKHRLFELDPVFRGDDEMVASACDTHLNQVKAKVRKDQLEEEHLQDK